MNLQHQTEFIFLPISSSLDESSATTTTRTLHKQLDLSDRYQSNIITINYPIATAKGISQLLQIDGNKFKQPQHDHSNDNT